MVCKATIYYFLPLIVIGVFYMMMARYLILVSKSVPGECVKNFNFNRQVQTRRKVAKVVLCFVLIFAVCFLPTHIFGLWFYFDPGSSQKYNDFWHTLRILGFCLSFMNSCINPIALYCISGNFRRYFNRYLLCCCCKEQEAPYRYETTITVTRYPTSIKQYESVEMTTSINDKSGSSTPLWRHTNQNHTNGRDLIQFDSPQTSVKATANKFIDDDDEEDDIRRAIFEEAEAEVWIQVLNWKKLWIQFSLWFLSSQIIELM